MGRLGLTDREITRELNLADDTVHDCISWLPHFLVFHMRAVLVLYASPAEQATWGVIGGAYCAAMFAAVGAGAIDFN